MPEAVAKPTFITLGPLRIRRRQFMGVFEKDQQLEVLVGAEGYGIYTQYIKNEDDINDFWDDYRDYQSQGLL